ncbi:hypothetical protein AB0M22_21530 [Nocardia sp. NPDC051756]|uniref:hypothetical protein n=1 Tax=Nocardia sp. NPDC051756 TaxID=3154751 RepID=UPI003418877D
MSAQNTVPFPRPRMHDEVRDLAVPVPRDEAPTYISPIGYPTTAAIAQFTLIGMLESRICTLASDIRLLRHHVHQLTVALDDSLDRESAHALCPHHECLVPGQFVPR